MPDIRMTIFDPQIAIGQAEARLLVPSKTGYVCIGRNAEIGHTGRRPWKQSWAPASELERLISCTKGQADVYMAQATFACKRRLTSSTREIRCAFVDLDTYTLGLEVNDGLIQQILKTGEAAGLPAPTYITQSGRGLYLKWVFEKAISDTLLPQWTATIRLLQAVFSCYGADRKVSDAARVLRPAESINSKSGKEVTIHAARGRLVDFAHLRKAASNVPMALLGTFRSSSNAAQIKIKTDRSILAEEPTDFGLLNRFAEAHEPVMLNRFSLDSLNWARFLDLRDLAIARGGIARGSRDVMLFWMVNFLAGARVLNPGNFWTEVNSLIEGFPSAEDFSPLEEGTLTTLFNRVRAHARGERVRFGGGDYSVLYTPKNDYLIETLQITQDEQTGLRTIIAPGEKSARAIAADPIRQTRSQDRKLCQRVAASLASHSVPVAEICSLLHKSRSTIYEWLTEDPRKGQRVHDGRGRVNTKFKNLVDRYYIHAGKPHLRPEQQMSLEAAYSAITARDASPPPPAAKRKKGKKADAVAAASELLHIESQPATPPVAEQTTAMTTAPQEVNVHAADSQATHQQPSGPPTNAPINNIPRAIARARPQLTPLQQQAEARAHTRHIIERLQESSRKRRHASAAQEPPGNPFASGPGVRQNPRQ